MKKIAKIKIDTLFKREFKKGVGFKISDQMTRLNTRCPYNAMKVTVQNSPAII
jgi:hypothetical protein